MAPDPSRAVRNLCIVHGLATTVTLLGFLTVGVGPFDAVLLAMATASTGGLFNGDDLESVAVQWVAIVGMAIAGTSLVVLWRLGWDVPGNSCGLLSYRRTWASWWWRRPCSWCGPAGQGSMGYVGPSSP